MKTVFPSRLLKLALMADAVATGAVALLQLAAPDALSEFFQLPRALLIETGILMMAYAALVGVLANCARLAWVLIALIAVGNIAMGALGAAVIAFGVVSPNEFGTGYLAALGAAAVALGVFQWKGLAASVPATSAAAGSTGMRS